MELLIVQYLYLLRRYGGPDAEQIKPFRQRHSADPVFTRRADNLDRVWRRKYALKRIYL